MVFKFRFQQLLDISLFEEDEIKNRLTAKNAQIAEITAKINKYKEDYERNIAERAEEMSKGHFEKFQMYEPYLNVIIKYKLFFENELEVQERQKQKIMTELLEKQKTRKTYEILRERDFENFRKEMFKLEQKVLDEFGKKSILTLDDE